MTYIDDQWINEILEEEKKAQDRNQMEFNGDVSFSGCVQEIWSNECFRL